MSSKSKNALPESTTSNVVASRRLRLPRRVPRRMRKQAKQMAKQQQKVPNAFQLLGRSVRLIASGWKLFGLMIVVYIVLGLIFVQTFSSGSALTSFKDTLDVLTGGHGSSLSTGTTLLAYLINASTTANSNPTAGVYQLLLAIIMSLAIIWALRQVLAGQKVRLRDTFYRSMYPLVPFVLVLAMIGLQLLPFALGAFLYRIIINNHIALHASEIVLWGGGAFLLALLSLYLVTSSLFALYIVSLPDMAPMAALRAARKLVRYRRWMVLRKILFLPLILTVVGGAVLIPVLLFATPVAVWLFLILSALGLLLAHSYMFTVYRALL